jgi:hypothetical protein
MRARPKALIGIFVILVVAGVAVIGYRAVPRVTPPTPPLLKDATASGGWWSEGCSRYGAEHPSDEARSPEVETRLKRQFPPGTAAALLEQSLISQGFVHSENCANDASIRRATFRQEGSGLIVYTAFAVVAWKVDNQGKIVWTKAMVAYTGL